MRLCGRGNQCSQRIYDVVMNFRSCVLSTFFVLTGVYKIMSSIFSKAVVEGNASKRMKNERLSLLQIQLIGGDLVMADKGESAAFIREMQERFDKKLKDNERLVLEYWKAQLDKIVTMKPEGVASLQMQIKRISEMMANRIKILKKE